MYNHIFIHSSLAECINKSGRFPYSDMEKGVITIHATGMPGNISIKKPASYGRKILQNILDCAGSIKFIIEK